MIETTYVSQKYLWYNFNALIYNYPIRDDTYLKPKFYTIVKLLKKINQFNKHYQYEQGIYWQSIREIYYQPTFLDGLLSSEDFLICLDEDHWLKIENRKVVSLSFLPLNYYFELEENQLIIAVLVEDDQLIVQTISKY